VEQYKIFQPVEDLPPLFSSAYACDGEAGLVLRLVLPGSSRDLLLDFGRVPAYRVTLEECALGRFSGTWDESETIACFTVRNSKWVSSFEEAELVHHRDPTHYVFLSHNQFVEILSCEPPSVRWLKAS
jgi:hypothetical protein